MTRFLYRIIDFLDALFSKLPTNQCVICQNWFGSNEIEYHTTTTGQSVPVCHACWEKENKYETG